MPQGKAPVAGGMFGNFTYVCIAQVDGAGRWRFIASGDTESVKTITQKLSKIILAVRDRTNSLLPMIIVTRRPTRTWMMKLKLSSTSFQVLYSIPSLIMDCNDSDALDRMCAFAEYHGALPALSRSLHGIVREARFMDCYVFPYTTHYASWLIDIAMKCRQRDLFQDCVIILAGEQDFYLHRMSEEEENNDHCTEPDQHEDRLKEDQLLSPPIRKVVLKARHRIDRLISKIQKDIHSLRAQDTEIRRLMAKSGLQTYEGYEGSLPKYYGDLKAWAQIQPDSRTKENVKKHRTRPMRKVIEIIEPLPKDNTSHDIWTRHCDYGCDFGPSYTNFFLCGYAQDEELPWPVDEIDW